MYYLIYNTLLFILTFVFLSFLKIPQRKKDCFLFVQMFIQLLFVHIFKDYTTLPDLNAYVTGFHYAKNLSIDTVYQQLNWSYKFEAGWCYLSYFLSKMFDHHIVLFIVTSGIIVGSHAFLSWRYSTMPLLSLFLFFFFDYGNSLFVLRQHTAMSICLLTIPLILERKIFKFFLIISIAFLIHKSALIFLGAYFIYPLKLNKKNFCYYIICSVVLCVFLLIILTKFSEFITGYSGYLAKDDAPETSLVMPLIQCSVLGLFLISSIKIRDLNGVNKLLFQLLLIAISIGVASVGHTSIIGRLNMYYTSLIFLTIPNILTYCDNRWRGLIKLVVFISFLVLFFVSSTKYIQNIKLIEFI